jgi:hypothetical protein
MKHKIKGGEARSAEHGREHGDVGRRAHPAHARETLYLLRAVAHPTIRDGRTAGSQGKAGRDTNDRQGADSPRMPARWNVGGRHPVPPPAFDRQWKDGASHVTSCEEAAASVRNESGKAAVAAGGESWNEWASWARGVAGCPRWKG